MTESHPLRARVEKAVRGVLHPGETVLVAVSGGVDSVVLLHLLAELAPGMGVHLHAAHLNHGLRGESADADERFVADLCHRLGVPVTHEKQVVKKQPGESTQQAARRVRYRFLRRVAASVSAVHIATGHHADDLAETFLMRMISGAGSRGLAGMATPRAGLVRPLLGVRKQAIREHAEEAGIGYREDASNHDPRYERNRLRTELMPALAAFNPNIVETAAREARLLAEEDRYLTAQATHHYPQVVEEGEPLTLDARKLAALPVALSRRVIHLALERLLAGQVEWPHVEGLLSLARGQSGRHVDLPGGLVAEAEYGHIRIGQPDHRPPAEPVVAQVPGITVIPWAEMQVEARYRTVDGDARWVYFDPARFSLPLTFRPRKPGDRFCPEGMGGHSKKVKDYLIDTKLPRRMRDRVPVLAAKEGVLWLVGARQDERFMVKRTSQNRPERRLPLALRIVTHAAHSENAPGETWKEAAP